MYYIVRVWVTLIGLITGTEETPAAMTFWRLMLYAFFVFIGLVIVSLVLPKLLARLIRRRDAKPRPLQTRNPKR